MPSLHFDGKEIQISQEMMDRFSDLIHLLEISESMTPDDKIYWVRSLENMKDDQVDSLRGILEQEQEKKAKIEEQFEVDAVAAIKQSEQDVLEKKRQEKRDMRKNAETKSKNADQQRIDELLSF
ncbi:hypothetical protein COB57_05795 [Candidatus Peregrinibacteria bacterium]|nr:MAG: hypothetical protein COB57_05795 [Candidatus Peregrinibacteria bacterium]